MAVYTFVRDREQSLSIWVEKCSNLYYYIIVVLLNKIME